MGVWSLLSTLPRPGGEGQCDGDTSCCMDSSAGVVYPGQPQARRLLVVAREGAPKGGMSLFRTMKQAVQCIVRWSWFIRKRRRCHEEQKQYMLNVSKRLGSEQHPRQQRPRGRDVMVGCAVMHDSTGPEAATGPIFILRWRSH